MREFKYIIMVVAILSILSMIGSPAMAATGAIKFITIGDPHLGKYVTGDEEQRLIQAVNYINTRNDIDFVVVMGDIANNGTAEEFSIGKYILDKLNKPYYMVAGNHDIRRNATLIESYFGPMENVTVVNGYQLLFIGIWNESTPNAPTGNITLHWSFNFNDSRINKNMPTIVFLHGEVQNAPPDCCLTSSGTLKNWNNSLTYYKYAWSMQPELAKFTNLISVYSGHVHVDSNLMVNGTKYITIASLTNNTNVGWIANPSDNIGLSTIDNGNLNYNLVHYFNQPNIIPNIISQSPVSPVEVNQSPSTVIFNISLNKAADVIWQLDGFPVYQTLSTIDSSFTNTTFIGKHSVIANPVSYGASPYEWLWNVTGNFAITSDTPAIPVGISTPITFTVTRLCGSEQGDICLNTNILPVQGANISIGANATVVGSKTTDINGQAIMNITATKIGTIRATATKYLYSSSYTEIIAGTNATVNLTLFANPSSVIIGVPTNILFTVTRPCGSQVGDNCTNPIPVQGAKVTMNASNGTYYGVNTTDNNGQATLTVNATHKGPIRVTATKYKYYSDYIDILAGPAPTPTPPSSSGGGSSGGGGSGGSSGGGGGGGGLASAESFSNILKYESQENFISTIPVPFNYSTPELSVYEVDILGTQSDDVTLRIEVLRDKSILVDVPAVGNIYKNINMWVNSKRIQSATIKFKIDNSWISNNGLSDIKLSRWNNDSKTWNDLLTKEINKDDKFIYFEAQTSGFSSFVIRGLKGLKENDLSPLNNSGIESRTNPISGTPNVVPTKISGKQIISPQIELAVAIIIVLLMFYLVGMKKK